MTAALSAACAGNNEPARDVASAHEQTPGTSTSFATTPAVWATSAEIRDVRAIHRSRCGSCHVPVAPGSHTRAELETAFTKHRTRVKMNDAEWSSMIDYLASDSANAKGPAISASK